MFFKKEENKKRTYQLAGLGLPVATIAVLLAGSSRTQGERVDDQVLEAFQAPANDRKGISKITLALVVLTNDLEGSHDESIVLIEGSLKRARKEAERHRHTRDEKACCCGLKERGALAVAKRFLYTGGEAPGSTTRNPR